MFKFFLTNMNKILNLLLLSLVSLSLSAQPKDFIILIKREKVVKNLVHSSIFLNGEEIGSAFENDKLKIPAGSYVGLLRYNSGRNFVQGKSGKLSNKGDFLLEVSGVEDRTDILLHQGNAPRHSKGCILLGPAHRGPDDAVLVGSEHPLYKLRLAFYGTDEPLSCPNINIIISIEESEVFKAK
jgi:hypothetical protein